MTQHTHQRRDPNPSGDEYQVVFVGVQHIRKPAKGSVNICRIPRLRPADGPREVAGGFDGRADDADLRTSGTIGKWAAPAQLARVVGRAAEVSSATGSRKLRLVGS